MNTTISKDDMRLLWSTACPLKIKDKWYRIGQMSYGDYFAEPIIEGKEPKETDMFNHGTLWFEKTNKGRDYQVAYSLS